MGQLLFLHGTKGSVGVRNALSPGNARGGLAAGAALEVFVAWTEGRYKLPNSMRAKVQYSAIRTHVKTAAHRDAGARSLRVL